MKDKFSYHHKLARAKYFQSKQSLSEICSVSPLVTNDFNKHWNILIPDDNSDNQHQDGGDITSLNQHQPGIHPIPTHL